MPVLTAAERLGTSIDGTYEVESILAHGGMGVVFAATHRWTGRRVAVKLLKPDLVEPARNARLVQEARATASLSHPNVVQVLDMGLTEDGVSYLVMELLEGCTLKDELAARGTLSPERALALLLPAMGAMAVAHDRGIVHRDLKPANIFLCNDPSGRSTTKVLDFGIAKVIEDTGMTRSGAVLGTPQYLSPEQAEGAADVGPSADVWAFGVMLCECLSGRVPFAGTHAAAIMQRVVDQAAPSLRSLAPQLPVKLSAAVDRALRRDPEARYPDLRSFARALALTARADGIALPLDADPIGLPEWRRWCTAGSDASDDAVTATDAGARPRAAASRRAVRGIAWSVALLVCAALGYAWIRHAGTQTENVAAPSRPASAQPTTAPPQPAAAATAVPEPAQHEDAPAPPEAASQPGGSAAPSNAAPSPPRRRKPAPKPSATPADSHKSPMLPW
jgi:serine/threonine protein kinase